MANPWWADFYKVFSGAFRKDPLWTKTNADVIGAGETSPDMMDVRGDMAGIGQIRLRETNDLVDTSAVSNRPGRYKEYERLRIIPEIENAMTTIADEACVVGNTKIATLYYGMKSIQWLAENVKEPFLVYCYDFEVKDYTLGWAYDPRYVKTIPTVRILLDDGSELTCTTDHRILQRNGEWIEAGKLEYGAELMPFYKLAPNKMLNDLKTKQFPRIYTFRDGWKHERQFIDEWTTGKTLTEKESRIRKIIKAVTQGLTCVKSARLAKSTHTNAEKWLAQEGFTFKELQNLSKKKDRRRVVGVLEGNLQDVYDLSVKKHENFCTDSLVVHNCQRDENNNAFKIISKNQEVVKELNFLFFHRKMLNFNRRIWNLVKNVCIFGDQFLEIILNKENPKDGILKVQELPCDSMYRIETVKGRLVEFQQSKLQGSGPDYAALMKTDVFTATEEDLQTSSCVRFHPKQIVHFKIGDERKTFYPYGVSLIEPARGPAHQLRLLEDAMVVYRLCLTGETRIRTNEGYKYIKDITEGDTVYSYNKGKLEKTLVTNSINNGNKKVYTVKSKHVEITGTETHPILVNRNGNIQYVDIKDLKVKEDKLILTQHKANKAVKIPRILSSKWAKLSDKQREQFRQNQYANKSELLTLCGDFDRTKQFLYLENKALPYKKAKKICKIFNLDHKELLIVNKEEINSNRINLPAYVDEEFARLFGFLCGDGNISKTYHLNFATSKNENINTYYKNLLIKYFGKTSFQQDDRCDEGLGKIGVSSVIACKILLKMGYINNHRNNRIPSWVFNAPLSIRRAFIEGFSDADGCERYTKKGTWFSTIELCNKKLIEDIKELWSSIGLASGKIIARERKGGHEIEPGRLMPPTKSYSITISDCLLPKYENVLSVTSSGEQEVYDISVASEQHNFIANGIPVHNSRAPERRIFYIDVGDLAPFRAQSFMERIKDQFRKKKVASPRAGVNNNNAVEERWHAPAADEDYWVPIRRDSQTRIDTLPGAQNLSEIDDALYFRKKLFTALNFPMTYYDPPDANATRITVSAQDCKFSRMMERIQSHVIDGLMEIAERHLELLGYPEDSFEDLQIVMTPPSHWKEASEAEIIGQRINWMTSLKSSLMMSDYDILTKWGKYSEEETKEIISRNNLQKYQDAKLQILMANPQIMGVGTPGQDEAELGAESGGPNPMLAPDGQQPPPEGEIPEGSPDNQDMSQGQKQNDMGQNQPKKGVPLGDPTPEEVKLYDLEIQGYSKEQDHEEIDFSDM